MNGVNCEHIGVLHGQFGVNLSGEEDASLVALGGFTLTPAGTQSENSPLVVVLDPASVEEGVER